MQKTTLSWSNDALQGRLEEVQDLVRAGKKEDAVELLISLGKQYSTLDSLAGEEEFLRHVDASHRFGAAESQSGWTPRQALIRMALFGGQDDCDPGEWSSSLSKTTLIDYAENIYAGPREHLEVAFYALIIQGLFFEVHPAVFVEQCFYCTFDVDFLAEFPNPDDLQPEYPYYERDEPIDCREVWTGMTTEFDEHFDVTWRMTGLCRGQGSQGPSDLPLSPCVGSCCSCYKTREKEPCTHELAFRLT